VEPTGIASGSAVGTPQANLTVRPSSVLTSAALGSPTIHINRLSPAGIATGVSVGTFRVIPPGGLGTGDGNSTASRIPDGARQSAVARAFGRSTTFKTQGASSRG
jgi:hypothetical protein